MPDYKQGVSGKSNVFCLREAAFCVDYGLIYFSGILPAQKAIKNTKEKGKPPKKFIVPL